MKNLFKISLIATVLFSNAGAYANNDDLSLKVKNEKEKIIRLSINQTQDMEVTFYDVDNDILYQKKGQVLAGSSKIYNLTAFPDGDYVMKLEAGSKLIEYQINIKNDIASVSMPSIKEVFKPILTKKNGLVTLNLDNKSQNPVELIIFDEFNNELYTKVYKDSAKLSQKFNVGKTSAKKLTFILRSEDQDFNKTIDIN
jgi:hypothetical protein